MTTMTTRMLCFVFGAIVLDVASGICQKDSNCLGYSCDEHIQRNAWSGATQTVTCQTLEMDSCDCAGCSCVVDPTATPPPTTASAKVTDSFQFAWFQEKGFSCQSQSGKGTALPIGADQNTFDTGITVEFCKRKCAINKLCQGFDFQDISGPQPPVCRYKGQIDSDTLSWQRDTSCYIYEREAVVPLTPPPTTAPPQTTCDELKNCLGGSCDSQILNNPSLTCTVLEKDGCNCHNCNCPAAATVPPTATATTVATSVAPVAFPFRWTEMKEVDCVSTMMSALHIGEGKSADGKSKSFDVWTVESCKEKCSKNADCQGFNYDSPNSMCRYKKTLSQAKAIPKTGHSCYIYDRTGTNTPPAGKVATTIPTTTTTPTFEFVWLTEKSSDCASPRMTQNLAIGDKISLGGYRQTFDTATVEKCKEKCVGYAKCDGFNYEYEMGICRYKTGISNSALLPDPNHNCFVYMRNDVSAPKVKRTSAPTTTTTTTTTLPPDTCTSKNSCLHSSCDWHIFKNPELTCDTLELALCDCTGCQCQTGSSTTSSTTTSTTRSYPYPWTIKNDEECAGNLGLYPSGSNLGIGAQGKPYDDNKSAEECKSICAKAPNCQGFNYNPKLNYGTCHYKAGINKPDEHLQQSPGQSCYIYLIPGIIPLTEPTASNTMPPTKPSNPPTKPSNPPTKPSKPPTNPPTNPPTRPSNPSQTSRLGASVSKSLATTAGSSQGNSNGSKKDTTGPIAGAVVGVILGVAAVAGAIVAAMYFVKKNQKEAYEELYHSANELTSGNTDL